MEIKKLIEIILSKYKENKRVLCIYHLHFYAIIRFISGSTNTNKIFDENRGTTPTLPFYTEKHIVI
jgi:hypothetical protein